jgi:hypothetical protein
LLQLRDRERIVIDSFYQIKGWNSRILRINDMLVPLHMLFTTFQDTTHKMGSCMNVYHSHSRVAIGLDTILNSALCNSVFANFHMKEAFPKKISTQISYLMSRNKHILLKFLQPPTLFIRHFCIAPVASSNSKE